MKIIQIESITLDELLKAIENLVNRKIDVLRTTKEVSSLLTRKQVKEKYNISYSSLSRYINKGYITPSRIGGKVFFDENLLKNAIKTISVGF